MERNYLSQLNIIGHSTHYLQDFLQGNSNEEAFFAFNDLNKIRKVILSKEEWLPELEADLCEVESRLIEKVKKEEKEEEEMFPAISEYDSLLNKNESRKTRGRKKHGIVSCHADIDKENANYYHEEFTVIYDNGTKRKYKFRDRIHGRRHGGMHGKIDFRYVDCNPYTTKDSYYDAQHRNNGKRHNSTRKASAMDAREQEYYSSYPVEEEVKEVEASTKTTEGEAGTFDDFLWYLIDTLSEGKYIVLYSFDNGQRYEDHDGCAYKFDGTMTKDKVIAELTENLLRHDCEVEVNETEVRGLKGIDFNWDFGTNEYWGDWNGYESFTIIPVSHLI